MSLGRTMRRHPVTTLLVATAYTLWALSAGAGLVRHRHAGGSVPHVHLAEVLAVLAHGHDDEGGDDDHHRAAEAHDHRAPRDVPDHHHLHPRDAAAQDDGPGVAAARAPGHWHTTPHVVATAEAPTPVGSVVPGTAAVAAPANAAPQARRLHVSQPRAPPHSLAS